MDRKTQKLGEILLQRGLVTQEQVDEALREQQLTKEFLGVILIRKGFVAKESFLKALSDQFKIPYVSLKDADVDFNVAMRFSASAITEHKCLPIKQDETHVTIAITNPLDAWGLSKAEEEARPFRVKWVLVSDDEINRLIVLYRQKVKENLRKLF